MVVSGVYDCQLVLVVKLAAVFQLRSAATLPSPCGFHGSHCCTRIKRYVNSMPTALNTSAPPA